MDNSSALLIRFKKIASEASFHFVVPKEHEQYEKAAEQCRQMYIDHPEMRKKFTRAMVGQMWHGSFVNWAIKYELQQKA